MPSPSAPNDVLLVAVAVAVSACVTFAVGAARIRLDCDLHLLPGVGGRRGHVLDRGLVAAVPPEGNQRVLEAVHQHPFLLRADPDRYRREPGPRYLRHDLCHARLRGVRMLVGSVIGRTCFMGCLWLLLRHLKTRCLSLEKWL